MNLVNTRRNRLYSQRDLAKKAGCTPSTIYLIESGRDKFPRLSVMRKISKALGVDAHEIDEFKYCLEYEPARN